MTRFGTIAIFSCEQINENKIKLKLSNKNLCSLISHILSLSVRYLECSSMPYLKTLNIWEIIWLGISLQNQLPIFQKLTYALLAEG